MSAVKINYEAPVTQPIRDAVIACAADGSARLMVRPSPGNPLVYIGKPSTYLGAAHNFDYVLASPDDARAFARAIISVADQVEAAHNDG